MRKERRSHLNLLLIRQSYLTRKIQSGFAYKLTELKIVQFQIEKWYDQECAKVALQSKSDEIYESEKKRIYHNELHHKFIKKSAKLDTNEGIIQGHYACAKYVECGELCC